MPFPGMMARQSWHLWVSVVDDLDKKHNAPCVKFMAPRDPCEGFGDGSARHVAWVVPYPEPTGCHQTRA